VETVRSFGFGAYQFQIIGRIDQLDPNVVLGLFDYPPPSGGPDGTNEIDIEFSRWGRPEANPGNYGVYPARPGTGDATHTFPIALTGDYTTHRFTRGPKRVSFQSLHGHLEGSRQEFASWLYQPADSARFIPRQATPVHLNLWLFKGKPPADGKEVEIVARRFTFTPR
jgi:hypothetical protein